jgi:hypothetical protein
MCAARNATGAWGALHVERRPGQPWMRRLKPLMAPVFRWNHKAVMRAGAVGLAHYLHTKLLASS